MGGNVLGAVSSPDGRTIAFVHAGEGGGGGGGGFGGGGGQSIYTIGVDGQGLSRVTQTAAPEVGEDGPPAGGFGGGGLGSLAYSRDGRALFYRQGRGIYTASVGGGGAGGATSASPAAGRFAAAAPAAAGGGGGAPRRLTFTAHVEVDHNAERKEVFEESWRIMKHRFYDPKMHGAD